MKMLQQLLPKQTIEEAAEQGRQEVAESNPPMTTIDTSLPANMAGLHHVPQAEAFDWYQHQALVNANNNTSFPDNNTFATGTDQPAWGGFKALDYQHPSSFDMGEESPYGEIGPHSEPDPVSNMTSQQASTYQSPMTRTTMDQTSVQQNMSFADMAQQNGSSPWAQHNPMSMQHYGSMLNLQQQTGMPDMHLEDSIPNMETIRQRAQSHQQNIPSHDGAFRFLQDSILQQHSNNTTTGLGQPAQAHRLSEDHAGHSSISSEGQVAITPNGQQSLPAPKAALAPNPSMGPMSRTVDVPARPKPGRKPLQQEDAQDRRRVQNRVAQRNFRDKRAQKVSELTADNDRIRKEAENNHKMLVNKLHDQKQRMTAEIEQLRSQLAQAQDRMQVLLKRAEDAEKKNHSLDITMSLRDNGMPNADLQKIGSRPSLPSMIAGFPGPGANGSVDNAVITPPTESGGHPQPQLHLENEIDMQNVWQKSDRKNKQTNQNTISNDESWLTTNMEVDAQEDDCGFCTNASNCVCIQSKKSQPIIEPGGCDACIADPARAAACKALADQTEVSQRPTQMAANNGRIEQRNDSMAAPTGMMSCSSLFDKVGTRMPSIAELGLNTFHSYPSGTPGSGYDVNEQEAAQVLQSMSRRNTVAGSPR